MRIGIFGGTFDPIHRAHVAIGRAALNHKALEQVLFVVAADPPHKGAMDLTEVGMRYAMVEAALADEEGLTPCDIELHRAGPSYTVDTVKALRALYPDAEFYLIVGEDSLIDLPNWYHSPRILEEVRLLVLPRPGSDGSQVTKLADDFEMLPFEESFISSTSVRERILAGDAIDTYLPPAVERIIKEKGLYHAYR